MGRREFITLLGGTGHLAASALAQHAQERDKVYQVGYLGGSQSDADTPVAGSELDWVAMTNDFDPFDSPKRSLARANHHISDLDSRIKTFTDKPPWTSVIEDDDQGVEQLHKLKLYDRIDDTLASVAFDASNNLRAVLDQMAFGVAVLATGTEAPRSAKFPFGKTEVNAINNAKGGCKDLPAEIRELFIRSKPYQGGNGLLRALNELANTKKHKMLIPIALGGAGITVIFTDVSGLKGSVTVTAPTWDPEKNELVFLRVPKGSKIAYQAHFRPSVTFDDVPDPIRGEPPVLVLSKMVDIVEGVLMATEQSAGASNSLADLPIPR